MSLDPRIDARIDRTGECWLWTGYIKANGYGSLTISGRGESIPGRRHRQTHCQHGHEFTEENTHVSRRGHRRCRTCDRARARRLRVERSAA